MSFLHVLLVIEGMDLVGIVELSIMAFSIFLCTMAVTAYRNTRVKKVGFAAIAFALFAIQLFVEYADDAFNLFDEKDVDLILSLITLIILLLFFIAILKKRKPLTEFFSK